MLLFFQIFFTVCAAICVGAVVPLGIWLDWLWAGFSVLGAILCYVLMLLCKQTRAMRGEIPTEDTENTKNTDTVKNTDTAQQAEDTTSAKNTDFSDKKQ